MEASEIKSIEDQYNSLVGLGKEFFEIFPNLTGVWSEDKEEFIKAHKLNNDLHLN